ncbi:MAG TPA: ATP-grasp domain-containing protein [Methanotrichaceae archaeon]|nr:ATP-grasp domain-containing protein [Methanotrichaceae archaeon]
MKILLAEYATAVGLGGTYEVEGTAMLSTLASSFQRCGHEVVYPTSGPRIEAGSAVLLSGAGGFEDFLASISKEADAGLLIAPDEMQAGFLEVLEDNTVNLGCSPEAARLCADKLASTRVMKENGVPVAEIVPGPEPCECGCRQYVIKPRSGCGSEGVHISSSARAPEGYIATRYVSGMHLSASFVAGKGRFLPLTINRQLIEFEGEKISYNGSQVPYNTPRAGEIWEVAEKACRALGLSGYAGIDFVVGDLPRAVDVNARPTTSLIGIVKVMQEEIADLLLAWRFGELPERITIQGMHSFSKSDLGAQ